VSWIQTASGRRFDLAAPEAAMVDFDTDVPDALARIARFTGHIGGGPYSVAQHSVHCCDVVLAETGDPVAAAYALLHDAHEAYIGDWSTPLKQAIGAVERGCGVWQHFGHVEQTLKRLEDRVVEAVHAAAGLPLPGHLHKTIVKDIDYRMLHAERRQLLDTKLRPSQAWWYDGTPEQPRPIRSLGALGVWPWPYAADRFRTRFRDILPKARQMLGRRGAA
jgi:hypothetical protein